MSKLFLKEAVDYHWIMEETPWGPLHKHIQLNDGQILSRENSPQRNSIVLLMGDNELRPVYIISGERESNGRISNFWNWYEITDDLRLGEIKSGYGYFYKPHKKLEIKR